MPFLDHLEELRLRILRSLAALVVGAGVGFWLVQQFRLVAFLKIPIAPYLPDGKLTVLSPTDPVMIVLKLSLVTGLVLASPVIIWQVWAFLSPALYQKERKALMPALVTGLVLFLAGGAFAWLVVVPKALQVLLSFQAESFATMITYEKYFGFVLQIVLAMGLSTELPLLLIILTALGIVTPATLSRFRRVAVVLAFIAGALLSPGADVISMLMMTAPLLLLYEVGIAGSVVVHRRRLRREAAQAALLVLLCLAGATPARAQNPPAFPAREREDALADSLARPSRSLDSASARRLGLPSGPSQTFQPDDSVTTELLERSGFLVTRYKADTATISGPGRELRLSGRALTEREGTVLEAGAIAYREAGCELVATGDPRLFEGGSVLIGARIRYDTCLERGVMNDALTTFSETGAAWILRGNLGVDSASTRVFAASSEMTSCDLPVPHYHFAAGKVKWVSKSLLVARPAVLYVRDVPVMWIPFMFQETKPGRRSGILVPQFGFNDIVRTNTGYNRQVSNFGYYWAPSDYFDAALRMDWYSNNYFRWSVATQYRWLDRFVNGAVEYSRQSETGGSVAQSIRWQHQQAFGITTTLNLSVNLSSNTSVIYNNALDPLLTTQQLASDLNLSKRFSWGQVAFGGRRRQTLGDDQVSMTLPSLAVSPKPLDFGTLVTWSPALTVTNDLDTRARTYLVLPLPDGTVDSIEQRPSSRVTAFRFDTPFRIGAWNWRNSVALADRTESAPETIQVRVPNESTPDPTDSITVSRRAASQFTSEFNWDTGFNLPLLFRGSWMLTPSLGITNTTSGPFAVRNERTEGAWVVQGKRLAFGLVAAPTFFGFFPGFGPIARIRHAVSPTLGWSYSPKASIPREYAEATTSRGQPLQLTSNATQTLTLGLSQNFEAKQKSADTSSAQAARKFRLLSINTGGIAYDLEQAKQPGRTGWATQTVTNSFLSDLLPGFNLSLTHDLWDSQVGTDSTKFDLFLQNVTASFALSSGTLRSIGALFGLGGPLPQSGQGAAVVPSSYITDPRATMQQRTLSQSNQLGGARRPFSANFNISLSRTKPIPGSAELAPEGQKNIGFSTSFSPTRFWGVSWSTQYNITGSSFEAQIIRLERDLHDWRAGFNFVRNPNGNFAFYFTIHLVDLPDLKLDYNQNTLQP
jgi:Tat protein translocase TatC